MTRGLVSAQTNILDDNAVIVETLLQIVLNNVSVFLTTGQTNTIATTSTSGGSQTYQISDIGSISEIIDTDFTTENRIAINFFGNPTVAISPHTTTPLNYPNYDTRFIIHKLFRNLSDNQVASADPILVFDGILVKKMYTFGSEERNLTFECIQKTRFSDNKSNFLNNNGLGVV